MNHKPLFLAVTLAALLVISGVFWMMQKRQVALNQPVVTDPVVETPVQTEPEKYPQHIEAIPGNTDEVWYNIPELGVRMRLNKDYAENLVYEYGYYKDGAPYGAVYLGHKREIQSVDEKLSNSDKSFAAISKIAGDVATTDNLYMRSRFESTYSRNQFKQFDGYYLYIEKPNTFCRTFEGEKVTLSSIHNAKDECAAFQTAEPVL